MSYPTVILFKGKERSLQRKHPWVFSGAIKKIIVDNDQNTIDEGELVEVRDFNDRFLGIGHFQTGTIAVRIISFQETTIDTDFWFQKLSKAFELRKKLQLTQNSNTNMYRLVHAEGDGLPGLITDYYNGTVVIQTHSVGMHLAKKQIAEALKEIYGDGLIAIYDKSADTMAKQSKLAVVNDYLYKNGEVLTTGKENDCTFELNWVTGQKTGFFLDQRENRKLLTRYVKGKEVLNTFCYSGGFSVYALKAGAKEVHSVDSSQKAITLCENNVQLNQGNKHKSYVSDTLQFLKDNDSSYDVIVLDPPAYAKHQKAKHNAVQGYKRLNTMGLEKINKGGILFTFSCSQVISQKLFYDTVMAAAIDSKRNVKVLHHLSQPADHPVSIFHPEGAYLKGLVLYVE